jgi:hypothetical protein
VPRLEDLLDLGVAKKLLEEDVGLQRLELRLAQEGFGVLSGLLKSRNLRVSSL